MPLEFADFAHHYEGRGLSGEQERVHFEAFADLMECMTRLFWREETAAKPLGISYDGVSIRFSGKLESQSSITTEFNSVAADEAARKKES